MALGRTTIKTLHTRGLRQIEENVAVSKSITLFALLEIDFKHCLR